MDKSSGPQESAEDQLDSEQPEEKFRPPEEVAGVPNEAPQPDTPSSTGHTTGDARAPKKWGQWRPTKKQSIIIAAVVVVLAAGGVVLAVALNHPKVIAPSQVKTAAKSPPIVSPLTGLPVTAAEAKRPVTGVMIENSDFARPQSGLKQAGVVFEAIAEGGITRFLALYQEAKPANIGPIRSARPYFLEWDLGFDAPLAHVGGSPQALADIQKWHVKDLDQFYNGAYYHRISSREAPHNVYTSIAELNALEKTKGWTTSQFTGFLRKKAMPAKKPTATRIHFEISWSDYYVSYKYDKKDNAYLRWEGGAPHLDAETKTQLEPKVVIGLVVPYSLESDGYHSDYQVIGSGAAYVFQDGTVTKGTWSKSSRTGQIKFTKADGQPLRLDPGQTWITALGSASDINYQAGT